MMRMLTKSFNRVSSKSRFPQLVSDGQTDGHLELSSSFATKKTILKIYQQIKIKNFQISGQRHL